MLSVIYLLITLSLRCFDLSFNNIQQIENIAHLSGLKEVYFIQNKITKIDNLSTLVNLKTIELAANRIRVPTLTIHYLNVLFQGN